MSLEIPTIKRKPGRPKKLLDVTSDDTLTDILESDMDTEDSDTEDSDIDIEDDFEFISTGSETKDRALKGVINDAPALFLKASKAGKWDDICKSANPAGECEKFAISQYVEDESQILSTLLAVKKLIIYNRDGLNVIKAFGKSKLEEFVKRVKKDTQNDTNISKQTESVIENSIPVVECGNKVTFEIGQKVFNPDDPSQFWIVGSRGRKPLFFKNLEENGTTEKIKIVPSNIVVNPDDPTQTFDLSKRGRRPLYVVEYLKTHKQG